MRRSSPLGGLSALVGKSPTTMMQNAINSIASKTDRPPKKKLRTVPPFLNNCNLRSSTFAVHLANKIAVTCKRFQRCSENLTTEIKADEDLARLVRRRIPRERRVCACSLRYDRGRTIAEPKRKGVPPDLLLDAECELWPMNSQVCRIHKSWSDFCDHSDRFADVYSSCQPQREGIGARLQIKPAGNSVR